MNSNSKGKYEYVSEFISYFDQLCLNVFHE